MGLTRVQFDWANLRTSNGLCGPREFAKALLDEYPDPDDTQIKDYLAGNLCRCAAYPEIINAVKMAARTTKAGSTG